MARVAYFQAFAGASGDMFLGALVDAGWPADELKAELGKLNLRGYEIEVRKAVKGTIACTKVDVKVEEERVERGLEDILAILRQGALSDPVRKRSEAMFRRLAECEAAVHGEPLERIHFHEVGALDSILDVVGAAAGLEWLAADEIVVSPINAGGGIVSTRSGKIPVPGMATLRLAQEVRAPLYSTSTENEFLTTTGALILTSAATSFGPMPLMTVTAAGYGAGSKDFDIPNVLRVVIGERASTYETDVTTLIETNLDDLSPEVVAYVSERLLEAGALDVYTTPIVMKKGRAGATLSVIAAQAKVDALVDLIFGETTTLGVRMFDTVRRKLPRSERIVATEWGNVRVKVAFHEGRVRDISPEYDDCRRLAMSKRVPIRRVVEAAVQAGRSIAEGLEPPGIVEKERLGG